MTTLDELNKKMGWKKREEVKPDKPEKKSEAKKKAKK